MNARKVPISAIAHYAGLAFLGLFLCLQVLGCGYKFVRYADRADGIRKIAILGIENGTFEPGVDHLMKEALHREFRRRKALIIVADPEDADLVLGGGVDLLETDSLSFTSIAFAVEYQLRMRLALEIKTNDGRRIPIDDHALRATEIYLASADIEVTRKNRQEAIRKITFLLASRIHDALFERMSP
jgi:hypothetical protein